MNNVYAGILRMNGGEIIKTAMLCFQCGACTASCPLNMPDGPRISPRRLMRDIQLGLPTNIDPFLCMMCLACESTCPRGVRITEVMHWLRRKSFKENKAPPKLVQALWNVYEEGNPWGYPAKDRGRWINELGLDILGKRAKILLYVGCISSYDIRLQKVVGSLVKLLTKAGVEFTVLGERERCCGDAVLNTGETEFLEELIQNNIGMFRESGAETIITLSPHCYQMIKNIYPEYGGDFEALHYTEYLATLLDENRLKMGSGYEGRITYHDPCYLGRYSGIFEEPRKLLEHLKGVEISEMQMSKMLSLCCGGGGGRIFMETKPEERPSNIRVRQAVETGADTIVTSCPYCIINFEDSIKVQKLGMRVMDVAELLASTR